MNRRDAIVKHVHIAAPIDRVWGAITTADHLAHWFGDSAEVDLRVGGSIMLGWSEYDTTTSGVIERVDEPTVFAFRWQSSPSADGRRHSTLVTFTLAAVNGGTGVTVEETGLARLPDDIYGTTLAENASGWTAELAELDTYVGGST